MVSTTESDVDVVILDQTEDHECLFLKLTCLGNVLILVSVYRPVNSDSTFLHQSYQPLQKYRAGTVIVLTRLF